MRKNPLKAILCRIIGDVTEGRPLRVYTNPIYTFSELDATGYYDKLSLRDRTLKQLDCKGIGEALWDGKEQETAWGILGHALGIMSLTDEKKKEITDLFLEAMSAKNPSRYRDGGELTEPVPLVWTDKYAALDYDDDDDDYDDPDDPDEDDTTVKDVRPSPRQIFDYLDRHIMGQYEAKKAA